MFLMNKDIPVLFFDNEDKIIKILNNEMLPYQLIDNIKDSSYITTLSEGIKNYDKLRFFFSDRVLSSSRDNGKQILQSINSPHKLTTEEEFKLSLRCRGVSINDSFWVKNDDEDISFEQINIRKIPFKDITFQISIKGTPISIRDNTLDADITTKGMFRKTWKREKDGLYLYKSDRTSQFINSRKEVEVSNLLDEVGFLNHVKYTEEIVDGIFCCKCKCFNDDNNSFIDAEYIKYYCNNHGIDFISFIKEKFLEDFANMVIIDYCFCNPDKHLNNFGFMVDTNTNKIKSLSLIFDNNQAMISFETKTEKEFDNLIYPATNKTIIETALEWFKYSSIDLSCISNINVRNRYLFLKNKC